MNGQPYTPREDAVIRQYAGVKTAEEIGLMLGRPKHGVHHRIKALGLKGYLYGEAHWAAKVDNLRMGMIHALLDAGYQPHEVKRMFAEPLDLSDGYLSQISSGTYRRVL